MWTPQQGPVLASQTTQQNTGPAPALFAEDSL